MQKNLQSGSIIVLFNIIGQFVSQSTVASDESSLKFIENFVINANKINKLSLLYIYRHK